MANATDINNGFQSSGRSYEVNSSVIIHVEFGNIVLPSVPTLPTALIRFSNGSEYLYIGVQPVVLAEFEATCLRNTHQVGDNRSVGQFFNQHIRGGACYARLHQG